MTPKELFDVVSMALQLGLIAVMTFVEVFITLSVFLFIFDGIKAKEQQRKRKTGITVMFVIAIILTVLQLLLGIYAGSVLIYFLIFSPFA